MGIIPGRGPSHEPTYINNHPTRFKILELARKKPPKKNNRNPESEKKKKKKERTSTRRRTRPAVTHCDPASNAKNAASYIHGEDYQYWAPLTFSTDAGSGAPAPALASVSICNTVLSVGVGFCTAFLRFRWFAAESQGQSGCLAADGD